MSCTQDLLNNNYMDRIAEFRKAGEQALQHFTQELGTLKTGRATPALVEHIVVSVYGVKTRLVELASILVADPRTLTIAPWDKSITHAIVEAISGSKMGLSAAVSGEVVRVHIAPLTEESRTEIAKTAMAKLQEALTTLRRSRDGAREGIVTAEKTKELTEDQRYKLQEQLDKAIREYQDRMEALKEKKVAEIMTV